MGKIYNSHGNQLYPALDTDGLSDLLPGRTLIWHDEFMGTKLDSNKWDSLQGKGTYNPNMSYVADIRKVCIISDGLTFRCIKDYPNPSSGFEYSAAFIHTNNLFEFRYGRIEAKMRFPSESPHHTTIWTLGACYERICNGEFEPWTQDIGVLAPSCGEIDIAEYDNGTVGARMHWSSAGFDTGGGYYTTGGNVASLVNDPTEWHIYACEWTESSITFYVDGVQKGTWNISNATVNGWNPFNIPHFLILDNIVCLSGSVPNWEVADTNVAWVRVYAPVGVTAPIEETGISIPASASLAVGERHWLGTPTFTPSNPSDMTVKWLSHNEDIVTCYGGMLIGVSAGTTYVQATSKRGFTALCKVTVTAS